MKLTGIILAGGLSSRMGQDKGLILYKDQALVQYSIAALEPLCSEILISTNNPEYKKFGYSLVPDIYKECGPIGGIYSALRVSQHDNNLICPCDMPFVTPELFHQILDEIEKDETPVVASSNDKAFPTLGYYHRNSVTSIEKQIKKGHYKLMMLLIELKAKQICIEDQMCLSNFNYLEDLM